MPDRYQALVNTPVGSQIAGQLGLPRPEPLRRYEPGQPLTTGPVLVGGAAGGHLRDAATSILEAAGADVTTDPEGSFGALVYDASGVTESTELRELYAFFHPVIRRLQANGRLIVLGAPPEACDGPRHATAQRALEGFVRSAGKEIKGGSTAQLLYVAQGGEDGLGSTLRFVASAKSAYVSGQVIRVRPRDGAPAEPADWEQPLAGKVALVTGAARGIGESIAATLARDGAHVVCLDVPAQGAALSQVANRIGGASLQLDITGEDAPRAISDYLRTRHGGVDAFVHNAGVTRDKTLAGMDADQWDAVLAINLASQERINEALVAGALRDGGGIVSVSSLSGIAGNKGQTNYATSKAGVIGTVETLAPALDRDRTINAVAPGFIETEMTRAMPFAARETARRMNSLGQGGLPVDVAETVAWLASPASSWVNGNVVRVCGQSVIGA